MGYLTNFIVYMLAMVGVLVVAMLVFKHTNLAAGKCGTGKCLKVLDTLSLGARKTLYIISAGEEKFLIAGDVDRTTLISKLNPKSSCEEKIPDIISYKQQDFSKKDYIDKSGLGIRKTSSSPYNSVLKSLAEKMQGRV